MSYGRCVTSNADARWAVDASVAVASLDSSHEAHDLCREVLVSRRPALAGHALFETLSVLTRLPAPYRLSPQSAVAVLDRAYPERSWLSRDEQSALLPELARAGLGGGAVYDALVGWAARAAGQVLVTRDRRAERVYRALDVPSELIGRS
jgi:predicted nucleic acid-binding protein